MQNDTVTIPMLQKRTRPKTHAQPLPSKICIYKEKNLQYNTLITLDLKLTRSVKYKEPIPDWHVKPSAFSS